MVGGDGLCTESRVVVAAGGCCWTRGAGRSGLVDWSRDEVTRPAVITDQEPSEEPPRHVLHQAAAHLGGGGPDQLAVVPRGRGEDEAAHRAGREL